MEQQVVAVPEVQTPTAASVAAPNVELPQMTAEQAQQVLQQASAAKAKACKEEVDSVLQKHGCVFDLSMTLTTQGVIPRIRIVPLSQQDG